MYYIIVLCAIYIYIAQSATSFDIKHLIKMFKLDMTLSHSYSDQSSKWHHMQENAKSLMGGII